MFQSTHPHGVRHRFPDFLDEIDRFQSTHPHGVRRAALLMAGPSVLFQSTHPHGVRPPLTHGLYRASQFQSTHPHGVRQILLPLQRSWRTGFNPRTRTGCDIPCRITLYDASGFQSTHPHGVRHITAKTTEMASVFQSTHPHGVRRRISDGVARAMPVSIHAPARGATDRIRGTAHAATFQSTHPHGVRPPLSTRSSYSSCFNPRTRTGCDEDALTGILQPLGFNPRTRTGCDDLLAEQKKFYEVSIHAPARGATSMPGK